MVWWERVSQLMAALYRDVLLYAHTLSPVPKWTILGACSAGLVANRFSLKNGSSASKLRNHSWVGSSPFDCAYRLSQYSGVARALPSSSGPMVARILVVNVRCVGGRENEFELEGSSLLWGNAEHLLLA